MDVDMANIFIYLVISAAGCFLLIDAECLKPAYCGDEYNYTGNWSTNAVYQRKCPWISSSISKCFYIMQGNRLSNETRYLPAPTVDHISWYRNDSNCTHRMLVLEVRAPSQNDVSAKLEGFMIKFETYHHGHKKYLEMYRIFTFNWTEFGLETMLRYDCFKLTDYQTDITVCSLPLAKDYTNCKMYTIPENLSPDLSPAPPKPLSTIISHMTTSTLTIVLRNTKSALCPESPFDVVVEDVKYINEASSLLILRFKASTDGFAQEWFELSIHCKDGSKLLATRNVTTDTYTFTIHTCNDQIRLEIDRPSSLSNHITVLILLPRDPASTNETMNADWKSTIVVMYSPPSPPIFVTFIPAPAEFKFPGYRVDLRQRTDKLDHFKIINMTEFNMDCQKKMIYYSFENVTVSGIYNVNIVPWKEKEGSQICRTSNQKNTVRCNTSRIMNISITINTITARTSTTAATISRQTASLTQGSTNRPSEPLPPTDFQNLYTSRTSPNVSVISVSNYSLAQSMVLPPLVEEGSAAWKIIGCCTLGAIVLVVIVAMACKRKQIRRKFVNEISQGKMDNLNPHPEKDYVTKDEMPQEKMDYLISHPGNDIVIKVEFFVSVLIIYSSDNDFHRDVVTRFAAFLQKCCCCEVSYDAFSEEDVQMNSSLEWLLKKIAEVQNIIIINSEGAYRRFHARRKGDSYRKKSIYDTPAVDIFLPAMKYFEHELYEKLQHKFYRVYFPYCQPQHRIDLKLGQTYELMSHIEDLFLRLHGESKVSPDGVASVKNINKLEYTSSVEGQKLAQAIRSATQYFKENPGWFDENYELELPMFDTANVLTSLTAIKVPDTNDSTNIFIAPSCLSATGSNSDADPMDSGMGIDGNECNSHETSPGYNIDPRCLNGEDEYLITRYNQKFLERIKGEFKNSKVSLDSLYNTSDCAIDFIPPDDDDNSSIGGMSFSSEQRKYNTDEDWAII